MIKALVLISVFFLIGNFKEANAKTKTLVYCAEASPKTFNPQLSIDGPTFNATTATIYNRLLDFEQGRTNVIPSLAKSWKVSSNGKKVTFNLRKNVSFHKTKYFSPTRAFNADDVIFSFERMLNKKHPYHKVSQGKYLSFESTDMPNMIKRIEKINDYKVAFHLAKPEAPFISNIAMSYAVILSKEYADQLTKKNKKHEIDIKPVGTGPFILRSYKRDSFIRFVSNENYFLGASKIKKLVFGIIRDQNIRFQKLRSGECHILAQPSPIYIEEIKKNNDIKLMSQVGLNIGYLGINVKKPPLDNRLIRQAINYALNIEAYIRVIYRNQAKKAKSPIPNNMWGYNKLMRDYEYNPRKAKRLIKKSGVPASKLNFELWTLPISRPYNPDGSKMGQMMQADLAKVGIKVRLVTYKWGAYINKSRKGEHDLIQLGWTGDNGDPDNFLNTLLSCSSIASGSNVAYWCNKKFNKLIKIAQSSSNMQERVSLYKKAQQTFKTEAPWVTIAHSKVFVGIRKNVKNYKIGAFGVESFHPLEIE